jgi:hypothetical protein
MACLNASCRSVSDRTAVITKLSISKLMIARPTAGLLTGLLVAIFATPLVAQRASEAAASIPAHESPAAYNIAHELAFDGTVRETVGQHEAGSPAGLHVIVSGGSGTVDAHLGPFMTKETRDALHLGLPIHLVGEMKDFHGRQILLARLISFGGRTVVVRNTRGALVHYAPRPASATPRTVKSENGGSR